MNVNEVLQLVDKLVFERTGKHLDDLQTAVVEGSWQKQTYEDIAQKNFVTKNHVSDVGYQLWQILSEALGEDIKKSNFRSSLERINVNSSELCQNICNFNFGSQILYNLPQNSLENNLNKISNFCVQDLKLAPQIINFHERESELNTLWDWIFKKNTRLISVLGLSGIGKTTLIKRFIDLNLAKFEVIIWKSLIFSIKLDSLLADLLNICKQDVKDGIDNKLKQLFEILTEKKCLIVFDDVQNIFSPGQLAGQYQPEYEDYHKLFKMITEIEHQSSLILISQEQCAGMPFLNDELYSIKCLELKGLFNRQIINNFGLENEDKWLDLVALYEGNYVYLQNIAILIKNFFDGKIDYFLAENILYITENMRRELNKLFNRLSAPEKEIVLAISKSDKPYSKEELKQSLNLSSLELINGLQSLTQRYLLTKTTGVIAEFDLVPVFKEYLRVCCC